MSEKERQSEFDEVFDEIDAEPTLETEEPPETDAGDAARGDGAPEDSGPENADTDNEKAATGGETGAVDGPMEDEPDEDEEETVASMRDDEADEAEQPEAAVAPDEEEIPEEAADSDDEDEELVDESEEPPLGDDPLEDGFSPSMPGYGEELGEVERLLQEASTRDTKPDDGDERMRRMRLRTICLVALAALSIVGVVVLATQGTGCQSDAPVRGEYDVSTGDPLLDKPSPKPAETPAEPVAEPSEPAPESDATPTLAVALRDVSDVPLVAIASGEDADWGGSGYCDVSGWTDVVKVVAAENYAIGLRDGGTLVSAGKLPDGCEAIAEWGDVVDVAITKGAIVGIRADGTPVAAFSEKNADAPAYDFSSWSGVVSVSASQDYAVAIGLCADGTAVVAGPDAGLVQTALSKWRLPDAGGESKFRQVAVGEKQVFGLTQSGDVLVHDIRGNGVISSYDGSSESETSKEVAGWHGIAKVVANNDIVIGIAEDSTVRTAMGYFGSAIERQTNISSDWTDIVDVATDGIEFVVGVRRDGTVVAAHSFDSHFCDVSGWTGVRRVACTRHCAIGLCDADGAAASESPVLERRPGDIPDEDVTQEDVDRYTAVTTASDGRRVGSWYSYAMPEGHLVWPVLAAVRGVVPDPYKIVPTSYRDDVFEKDGKTYSMRGSQTPYIEVEPLHDVSLDGFLQDFMAARVDAPYVAATGISYTPVVSLHDFTVNGEFPETGHTHFVSEQPYGLVAVCGYMESPETMRAFLDSFVPVDDPKASIEEAGIRWLD